MTTALNRDQLFALMVAERDGSFAKLLVRATPQHGDTPGKPRSVNHAIFEGTSEIQQLVIARAISGLRIE